MILLSSVGQTTDSVYEIMWKCVFSDSVKV